MNTIPAANILDQCEQALRQSAGTALAAGDYDTARQIIAWAEHVAAMAAIARSPNTPALESPPTGTPYPVPPVPSPARDAASSLPTARPAKGRPPEDLYPRFLRRGDELVKIGWSKKDRKEYAHRAPRPALDAVLATLKRIASDGSAFTSDNLSLLKDPARGTVIPLYQVFVALAWLRKLGLVKQHGKKGGYTLTPKRSLDATVAAAWLGLPPWPG